VKYRPEINLLSELGQSLFINEDMLSFVQPAVVPSYRERHFPLHLLNAGLYDSMKLSIYHELQRTIDDENEILVSKQENDPRNPILKSSLASGFRLRRENPNSSP
jgi:hypothetical protein